MENNNQSQNQNIGSQATTPSVRNGRFAQSLSRDNNTIRQERAAAISEDAEITYRRTIEDLRLHYKQIRRAQENKLDFSPNDANSLKAAENFVGKDFVQQDLNASLSIRETLVKLQIAEQRYAYLFGASLAGGLGADEYAQYGL